MIFNKYKKEKIRLIAKISDKLFKTTKFSNYQKLYGKYYQNDYILNKNQFSFVHIPKTAGSYYHKWLKDHLTDIYYYPHNAVSLKCNPERYKYITIIRNPIQRIKSFYLMQKSNKKLAYHIHANIGLEFFLQKTWMCRNGMCKFLNGNINEELNQNLYEVSLKNLKNFFFVVDFNNILNDSNKLLEKLKIKKKYEIDSIKINRREVFEDEKDIIERYNYYDLKLFKLFKGNLT